MSVSVINRGGGESFKVSNGVSYNFDGTGTIKKWDFIRYKSSMTQKYTPEILNSSTEKIICCDMTSEESSYSDMSYVIAYITTSGSVYVQGVREDKGTSTIHYKTDLLKIYSSGDTSSAAKIKLVRLGDDVTQLGVVFDTSYGVYAALVKCMLFSNDVSISLWVSPKLVSGSIYKNRWDLSVLYYSPVTETIIFSANNTTGYYTKVGFYNSGSIVADTSVSKANIVTSSLPTGALVCPSSNALTPSSSSTQKKGNCFIQTKDSVLFWSYDAKNKTEQLTTLTNERGLSSVSYKNKAIWCDDETQILFTTEGNSLLAYVVRVNDAQNIVKGFKTQFVLHSRELVDACLVPWPFYHTGVPCFAISTKSSSGAELYSCILSGLNLSTTHLGESYSTVCLENLSKQRKELLMFYETSSYQKYTNALTFDLNVEKTDATGELTGIAAEDFKNNRGNAYVLRRF